MYSIKICEEFWTTLFLQTVKYTCTSDVKFIEAVWCKDFSGFCQMIKEIESSACTTIKLYTVLLFLMKDPARTTWVVMIVTNMALAISVGTKKSRQPSSFGLRLSICIRRLKYPNTDAQYNSCTRPVVTMTTVITVCLQLSSIRNRSTKKPAASVPNRTTDCNISSAKNVIPMLTLRSPFLHSTYKVLVPINKNISIIIIIPLFVIWIKEIIQWFLSNKTWYNEVPETGDFRQVYTTCNKD